VLGHQGLCGLKLIKHVCLSLLFVVSVQGKCLATYYWWLSVVHWVVNVRNTVMLHFIGLWNNAQVRTVNVGWPYLHLFSSVRYTCISVCADLSPLYLVLCW